MGFFSKIFGDARSADKLKKSEDLYRSLFEHMLNGFAYCKMIFEDGKPSDFVYLNVNRAFETLTGLKNVVGKKVSEVIPGIIESDKGLLEIYGSVAMTGVPEKFEMYVEALKMWFSISVYSHEKGYFVAIFDAITQRKKAELELEKDKREMSEWSKVLEDRVAQRTEELQRMQKRIVEQEKLAVLGQIAASISHELRTPLTGIKNSTYLMRMLGFEKVSPKIAENLSLIDMEVNACTRVLNNMLDFVRPKMPIKKESRLDLILTTALGSVMMPSGIKVATELAKDVPPMMLDSLQIQQAFDNIIKNAIDAMGMGGNLTIRLDIFEKKAVVSFADNGAGIAPADLKKIFDPLYSTTPTGVGLGLTIARQLIEAHGGTIEAESRMGQGSTFRISLPVADV